MPPTIALFLWFVLLMALLCFDPARERKTSWALWVPVLWMFFAASRLPSQWLGVQAGVVAEAMEEGNPLDRTIYFALILLAVVILLARSFNWSDFLTRNSALTLFLLYALVSMVWSDFPFIAFKRWFRDLGNYFVVLVVLSDPRPAQAVRTVFRRLFYLLIPLSVLLIKYFPQLSVHYAFWTGGTEYVGVATSKNMLGVICLVSGIYFFWDTVSRWSERKQGRTKQIFLVNLAFFGMTVWVLLMSNSATSRLCMALGCMIVLAVHSKTFQRRPRLLKAMVPTVFCLYLVLAIGFDFNAHLAGAVGRDPTLTDRTKIWETLLGFHVSPVLGAGYESFWLGPRLQKFWETFPGLNEAHNGYLEVYLNLGGLGLFLLGAFLIASYRSICKRLTTDLSQTSLAFALWTVILFYSVTEAGFRSGLMWLAFLMGGIFVARRAEKRVPNVAKFENQPATVGLPGLTLEIPNQRR